MRALRDYQTRAVRDWFEAVDAGARAVLLVAPCGAGKTTVGVAAATRHLEQDPSHRVVWLAHRRELVKQAAERVLREGMTNLRVVMAGQAIGAHDARVTVASIQTLIAREHTPPASMIVIDEAHHTCAPSFRALAAQYPRALHLGLTATPERGDGTPLGDVFDRMIVVARVRELVAAGHLVPCDAVYPSHYLEHGIAWEPVSAYEKFGNGRRAVVFTQNVRHARQLAHDFEAQGVRAACIDGQTSLRDRDHNLARFRAGELDVLTNVHVLTEGWDAPEAEVCILARGCSSDATYLQMVGRVLRPSPGKERALLVDLRGVVFVHGLPDEDREYSLEGRHGVCRASRVDSLRTCPECAAVFASRPTCPRCAYAFPPPPPPRILNESLGETPVATRSELRAHFDRLVRLAVERGYRSGWVGYRFREQFGFWPPFPIPNIAPKTTPAASGTRSEPLTLW